MTQTNDSKPSNPVKARMGGPSKISPDYDAVILRLPGTDFDISFAVPRPEAERFVKRVNAPDAQPAYDPEVVRKLIDFVVNSMNILEKKEKDGFIISDKARSEYDLAKPIIADLKGEQ